MNEYQDNLKRREDGYIDIEIKKLIDWQGGNGEGCIVSNKISKEGWKVGYMYREEPDSNSPDSGWRFLKGDEDKEYMDDADNANIFSINTICNYDPDIIKYLNAPYGVAFIRISDTEFEIDREDKPIYFTKQVH